MIKTIMPVMALLLMFMVSGCGSKEPLTEDISVEVSMQGVDADILEDSAVGTLLTRSIHLDGVTAPLSSVVIRLVGEGSADFNVTLENIAANSYIGKVALLHTLIGKGGINYALTATAVVNGENIGSVPVKIHIKTVPKWTITMLCDEANGTEPWISDGTTAGTKIVKNINPDGDSIMYAPPVKMGHKRYMSLDDGSHGATLWESNGTAAGTKILKDINETGTNDEVRNLTVVADRLYFSAYGHTLWRSDGTAEGTQKIKDINASEIRSFASYHDKLYFVATGSVSLRTRIAAAPVLWESDGTAAGTKAVLTLPFSDKVRKLRALDDKLYFALENSALIYHIDMSTSPLEASMFYGFSDNRVRIREMEVVNNALYLITILDTNTLYRLTSDGMAHDVKNIDLDFGLFQLFEGKFLLQTMRVQEEEIGISRYMQLQQLDLEGAMELIKESRCPNDET